MTNMEQKGSNSEPLSEDKTLLDLAANIIHDCNEYIGANLVNGEIEQFFTRYKQLKDNIPEPDRIAELENQNEALARNLAELQVMYGEAKAKLNAIPEPDSQPDELFEEAEAIMVRKFPPEEYGEDGDLAVIYDILRELRDLAKATR